MSDSISCPVTKDLSNPFVWRLYSVRNHGGVPDIQEDLFRLEIGGLVNTPVELSLKDLRDPEKFPLACHFPSFQDCWLIAIFAGAHQSSRGYSDIAMQRNAPH